MQAKPSESIFESHTTATVQYKYETNTLRDIHKVANRQWLTSFIILYHERYLVLVNVIIEWRARDFFF